MSTRGLRSVLLCLWLFCLPSGARAQAVGRIEGIVELQDATGIAGVSVTLAGTAKTALTRSDGTFSFEAVPPGDYQVLCRLADQPEIRSAVQVRAGQTATVTVKSDWRLTFADTITVSSVSRRPERIVEAPGAVTYVGEEEVRLRGASGQLPKLLEFTSGVQVTQNGLYDFNLNARGFNNLLNRRIQTLVDGRNPAIPFVASQEWASLSSLADDLERIELLRGPSAALYGPNTFNGVINLVTKAPRYSQGGLLRVTAGGLETRKADLRWAGGLGEGWYAKLLSDYSRSGDFTRSRNRSVEYSGLALEAVPLEVTTPTLRSASLRVDHYSSDNQVMTLEGGEADADGVTFITGAGRSHAVESRRPWGRFDFSLPHGNLLATYNRRVGEQLLLQAGARSFLDESNFRLELQGDTELWQDRVRLVGGASYFEQKSDSADAQGLQTLFAMPIHTRERALFGQGEFVLGDLKAVLAGRWDDSTLYSSRVSPKAGLVWSMRPNQTLRLSYNEAFQVGTHGEYFVRLPAGAPLDLSELEASLQPLLGGVSLGLNSIPILALGNQHLAVENVRSFELGYNGILGRRAFLNATYYRNRMQDFITDLLPGVHPDFGPYQAPSGLPSAAALQIEQTLRSLLPGVTNDAAGRPLIVYSFSNTGVVDSSGVELGLQCEVNPAWALDLSYAWFDFTVKELKPGTRVSANTPENSASGSLTFRGDKLAAALHVRWVEGFPWASGIFAGSVPSFTTSDLEASYQATKSWLVGLTVSNLSNDKHFEAFGGDLIGRRALGYVAWSW